MLLALRAVPDLLAAPAQLDLLAPLVAPAQQAIPELLVQRAPLDPQVRPAPSLARLDK